jgi:uncharacterized RmlC-like cupin family protein
MVRAIDCLDEFTRHPQATRQEKGAAHAAIDAAENVGASSISARRVAVPRSASATTSADHLRESARAICSSET